MKTWILLRNLPPELYGINLEKWEKEKSTVLWKRKKIPQESLKEYSKSNIKILGAEGDFLIIEEASYKSDSAHKIFYDILIRDRVDNLLVHSFLKIFPLTTKDIENFRSYYSRKKFLRTSGFRIKDNKIEQFSKMVEIGTQEIILLIELNKDLGMHTLSYKRKTEGVFKLENITVPRNKKKMKMERLLKSLGFPREFRLSEREIIKEIFED